MKKDWIIYGSELSPFTLKVIAAFQYRSIPFKFLFEEGSTWENAKIQLRKEALTRGLLPLTWPEMDSDDEFPLVPYLFGPKGENLYDSTAIIEWIEKHKLGNNQYALYCQDVPAVNFLIHLIDDYADDYGLYMVHHNRWKVSATTNNAGARLGNELRTIAGPLISRIAGNFSKRQVTRLPYLFSVAPQGFQIDGLKAALQPPCHQDFPPTHALLEESFLRLLKACELILNQQPYLFGNRFTLADASIYGQLGMNLKDSSAAQLISNQAPTTFKWITNISNGYFKTSSDRELSEPLNITDLHKPLLAEICRTYVPLMQQNLTAYLYEKSCGRSLFNEKAFNENQAIYQGTIDGTPFKHVAKSFQAKTWRQLRTYWNQLSLEDKKVLSHYLPPKHGLDKDE